MTILDLLGGQLRHIERCAPLAAEADIEALHQLRVAVRRLRALLRALRKPLRSSTGRAIERKWDELSARLGRSRDADVWAQLLASRRVRERMGDDPSWELVRAAQAERQARLKLEVEALLRAPESVALLRQTRDLIEHEAPRLLQDMPRSLQHRHLRKALARALARVRERARGASEADAMAMHRLRIAVRRARYLAEFTAAVSGPRRARRPTRLARRLRAVAAPLGELHDRDVQLTWLTGAFFPAPAALIQVLGTLREEDFSAFRRAWRRLRRATRRR